VISSQSHIGLLVSEITERDIRCLILQIRNVCKFYQSIRRNNTKYFNLQQRLGVAKWDIVVSLHSLMSKIGSYKKFGSANYEE
jgi:hypothetical protein